MNRAVFETIHVDVIDDEPQPHERGEVAAEGQHKTPDELSLAGGSNVYNLAEREGFEPSVGLPTTVFKTVTINHSVTSPKEYLGYFNRLSRFSREVDRQELPPIQLHLHL